MTLNELNALSNEDAATWFEQTCAATHWIDSMVEKRPFASIDELKSVAIAEWEGCNEADYLEAFTAHPMIGDVDSLRKKFANTKAIAAGEQSGASDASEATLLALKDQNHAYLEKHGFIFIICATGLSAQTMLNELNKRLPNATESEIATAAQEQIKITLIRFDKALSA